MNPIVIKSNPLPNSLGTYQSPVRAALAAQIGSLTHAVDKLEQFSGFAAGISAPDEEEIIATLHSTIDALNALYADLEKVQLDFDSLNRRLKWAQASAEKHHNGNIAACEREAKLRVVLESLVHSPDLNLENMDDETYKSIDEAKRLLYPLCANTP